MTLFAICEKIVCQAFPSIFKGTTKWGFGGLQLGSFGVVQAMLDPVHGLQIEKVISYIPPNYQIMEWWERLKIPHEIQQGSMIEDDQNEKNNMLRALLRGIWPINPFMAK